MRTCGLTCVVSITALMRLSPVCELPLYEVTEALLASRGVHTSRVHDVARRLLTASRILEDMICQYILSGNRVYSCPSSRECVVSGGTCICECPTVSRPSNSKFDFAHNRPCFRLRFDCWRAKRARTHALVRDLTCMMSVRALKPATYCLMACSHRREG